MANVNILPVSLILIVALNQENIVFQEKAEKQRAKMLQYLKIFGNNLYKFYAYAIFLITLLPFYPITALLVSFEKTRKSSTYVFWIWSLLLSALFFIFVRINRAKTPSEPCIIVANHRSYLDIFLMYQILPLRPIAFMGKAEILHYPLIKTYFKQLHIPVDRSDRRKAALSLKMAQTRIAEGYSVVIFPEGGIPDTDKKIIDFKAGAFVLAQKTKAPILPLSIKNHGQLLSEPQNILGSAHPGISRTFIHNYLGYEDFKSDSLEELKTKMEQLIASKLD